MCYAYGARATARATAKEKREVTLRGGFPVLVHYGGWRCRQEAGLMNRRPACRWEAVLAPQIHCNQQPQKRKNAKMLYCGLGWALRACDGARADELSKDYRALHT